MFLPGVIEAYKNEFSGYSWRKLQQDILAGLTVAAVALPLALAFGIASGATAAAGLVTSIIASVAMGLFAGAPYQVSGPTAGLVGVLFIVAQRHGLEGVWLASFLAGFILLLMGIFRLGRLIVFIPSTVITGFSSSVSLIIMIGQTDNFLGIRTPGAESSLGKLMGYFGSAFIINWFTVVISLIVILTIVFWPKSWVRVFPASLAGLIIGTLFSIATQWPVQQIGSIPQTLWLADRFSVSMISLSGLTDIFLYGISIAMLIGMECLLCGLVMGTVTGIPVRPNQELISQGIGNIILPFFGCIPAVSTLVRSSVMVKSGGQTRVAGLAKGVGLLFSMFLFAPVMSRVPMAALAGVLIVTAWRMNKWNEIHTYFSLRIKSAILTFLVTILVTIATDLVLGLLSGVAISNIIMLVTKHRLVTQNDET